MNIVENDGVADIVVAASGGSLQRRWSKYVAAVVVFS